MTSSVSRALLLLCLAPCAAKNYPLEIRPNATFEERRAAMFVREQRVLYDDPLYPHPDRLAGRALQGGLSAPAVTSVYGASMLGSVGKTTVAGTDPYSGTTFPVNTIIAGPSKLGSTAPSTFCCRGWAAARRRTATLPAA